MLDDIALFIKLCQTKSIKLCSELTNIHASTISKRISELEADLGEKLVIRTSKRFELTTYGDHVYKNCKHIPLFIEKIVNTREDITSYSKACGTVNAALGTLVSNRLICPQIHKFLQKYPNIKLNLSFYPSIRTWLDPRLDLVLSVDHIKGENLDNRFLRHEYIGLYCTKDYAIRNGLPLTIDELSQHKIIGLVDHDFKPLEYVKFRHRNTNDEYLLDCTNNQLNMGNNFHTIQVGLSGNYLFGAHESLIYDELRNGLLLPVLPDWYAFEIDFYIVSKKNISREGQLFIDFIYECMRNTSIS
ncbi:MAG: LysR family transcriptional regulator [Neisseriaceae bacterium]|nr:MAG: LysR family transcriptional regulator [Neisseriaceae bacterium]